MVSFSKDSFANTLACNFGQDLRWHLSLAILTVMKRFRNGAFMTPNWLLLRSFGRELGSYLWRFFASQLVGLVRLPTAKGDKEIQMEQD